MVLLQTSDKAVTRSHGLERGGKTRFHAPAVRSPACAIAPRIAACLLLAAVSRLDSADNPGGAEVGGELQALEKETIQTPREWATDRNPDWQDLLDKPAPETLPPPAEPEKPVEVREVRFEGDAGFFDALGLAARLRGEAAGKTLTESEILKLATKYREICVEKGYYLARVTALPADRSAGVLVFDVDAGRVGRMTFYDSRGPASWEHGQKLPYSGRYFSESQLRSQMSAIEEGDIFDYNEFYDCVFAVNAHPDLVMDTDLKIRKETADGAQRRFADMDFYVKEQRPLHGIIELKNTGTEATDEWRASATLQHLNLARRGDVLTVNTIASTDFDSLRSIAGSYNLPWRPGSANAVTFYGGYSEMAANDIVPLFDLTGKGWFAGAQFSLVLTREDRDIVTLSFSGVSRFVQNTMTMESCENGRSEAASGKATIVPVSVSISYAAGKPDGLGGRNFLTSQTSFNAGRFLGGSDDAELAEQRAEAGADYVIERIQAARLQPVFGRGRGAEGRQAQWILFLKLDGQYSTSPLIPVEQKAVGGMDSVRGYPERETLGDNGVSGTMELRTPTFSAPFSRKKGEESVANIQLLAFADGGYVALKDAAEDEEDSQSLLGVGLGARMTVTSHFQFRFDWGFPLEETATSDSGGRAHISAQAQF